jgi:hypothetical protein
VSSSSSFDWTTSSVSSTTLSSSCWDSFDEEYCSFSLSIMFWRW